MPTTGEVVLLSTDSSFTAPPSLIVYSSVGLKTAKMRVNPSCDHYDMRLLGLETDGQDFLLIACNECKDLKLLKLQESTATTVDVYSYGNKEFHCICRGEPGVVYVSLEEGFVHEYKYSSSGFRPGYNVIRTGESPFLSMCCITNGQRALVGCTRRYNSAGRRPERTIRAVFAHNSSVLWEFNQEINGTKLRITKSLYVAKGDVILIDDANNNRFVLLNSHDGSFLRTLKCMVHMRINNVINIDINKDKLSVLYWTRKGMDDECSIAVSTLQLNPLI